MLREYVFGENVKHFLMNGSGKKVFVDTLFLFGGAIAKAREKIRLFLHFLG